MLKREQKNILILWIKKLSLVFLKEPYINTELFQEQVTGYENIKTDDKDLEPLFKEIKKTLENLAKKQIIIAFEQSEKRGKGFIYKNQ